MKRILVILLALIIAATSFVSCNQEEPHTHAVSQTVEAKEATCAEKGNIKYYKCSCGKLFSDEACTKEIALADTVIEVTDEHTFDDEVAEWVRVDDKDVYLTVCTVCHNAHGDAATVEVGTQGPAGGVIFYINPNAEEDGWTYMETAPGVLGKNALNEVGVGPGYTKATFQFGAYFADVEGEAGAAGITASEVKKGKSNTESHVEKMTGHASSSSTEYVAMTDFLAKIVSDLSITVNDVTYDDWFIPSANEAKFFMNTTPSIGEALGLYKGDDPAKNSDRIWSSSERDTGTNKLKMRTWPLGGAQGAMDRCESYYCVPVRQF